MSDTPKKEDQKKPLLVQPDDASDTAIEEFITRSIANMIALIPPDEITKDPEKLDALAQATAVLVKAVEKYVRDQQLAEEAAQAKANKKKTRAADKGSKDLKQADQPIPLFFLPLRKKHDPQQPVENPEKLTLSSQTSEAAPEGKANKIGRRRKKSNQRE